VPKNLNSRFLYDAFQTICEDVWPYNIEVNAEITESKLNLYTRLLLIQKLKEAAMQHPFKAYNRAETEIKFKDDLANFKSPLFNLTKIIK